MFKRIRHKRLLGIPVAGLVVLLAVAVSCLGAGVAWGQFHLHQVQTNVHVETRGSNLILLHADESPFLPTDLCSFGISRPNYPSSQSVVILCRNTGSDPIDLSMYSDIAVSDSHLTLNETTYGPIGTVTTPSLINGTRATATLAQGNTLAQALGVDGMTLTLGTSDAGAGSILMELGTGATKEDILVSTFTGTGVTILRRGINGTDVRSWPVGTTLAWGVGTVQNNPIPAGATVTLTLNISATEGAVIGQKSCSIVIDARSGY